MDSRLADLLRQFELERLEVNLCRGESRDVGSPQVFGGQVLGQALMAAYATVEDQDVHSLHAYFLRRGDFNSPIVYEVDRARDGRSFSSRRVVAIQHGEQIFNLAASFQDRQTGFDHQLPMPDVPPPEALPESDSPPLEVINQLPEKLQRIFQKKRAFEFRSVEPTDYLHPRKLAPRQHVWLRAVGPLPDDDRLHRCLLAYVSDYSLLDTALRPHGTAWHAADLVMASIDHAMWFHRPPRVDQWLLYSMDSPSASGARGFSRGTMHARDGTLVASTAQEGLIRLIKPPG
ncbi:MAG: Acyl-CoA thioesterase 2 [Steroidobacteraceae bacterium]|nr:Acyl-CoA thioesterase 2 [Steroidobacteraceae bacterium]